MGAATITGVELRETSIRVKFTYQGKQVRETLTLNGKPLAPTPANIKLASRLVSDIRKRIACGVFDYAETFPDSKHAQHVAERSGDKGFYALIDRWYDLLELKRSTKTQYRRHKDFFWKKHLPDKPIKSFVHSDIKKALMQGTWKNAKSRNNQLSLIRSVFQLAVQDKQIQVNPCEGLGYAKIQKKKPDPFSQDEVRLILSDLKMRYPEPITNFVQFQFYTGLRTSEAIALDWCNVDINRREILIDCALVYDEESASTKTMVSRKVKLNSEAVKAIQRQQAFTFSTGGKVFSDPYYDEPWTYHRITDSCFWAPTLKRLGIRHRRPYNTRHTYATLALMSGANPAYMAKQMGHSTDMFFKVYADWINGDDDEREMEKIEHTIRQSGRG